MAHSSGFGFPVSFRTQYSDLVIIKNNYYIASFLAVYAMGPFMNILVQKLHTIIQHKYGRRGPGSYIYKGDTVVRRLDVTGIECQSASSEKWSRQAPSKHITAANRWADHATASLGLQWFGTPRRSLCPSCAVHIQTRSCLSGCHELQVAI
jgi:hypothetical protein